MKLSDYCREIYITQTKKLGGGHRAYCMDGGHEGRGSECDMAQHVGLASCHCCDYFLSNGGAVSFLEIKGIFQTKENFSGRYSKISRAENGNAELFMDHIAKESVLKLYGSMLVLCWFASCYSFEANRLRPKTYHFFLIVSDAPKNKDAKMLDEIRRRLERMKSVASEKIGASGVIREVHALSAEEFEKRLEAGAVSPS